MWVAVAYNSYPSFGQVLSILDQKNLKIKFLSTIPVDGMYSWPRTEEILDVELKYIIKPDIEVQRRGKRFLLPNIDGLRNCH